MSDMSEAALLTPLTRGFRDQRASNSDGEVGAETTALQARFMATQALYDESLCNQSGKAGQVDAKFNWTLLTRYYRITKTFYHCYPRVFPLIILLTCALAVAKSVVGYQVLLVPSRLVAYLIDRDESQYWQTVALAGGWVCLMVAITTAVAFVIDMTSLLWRKSLVSTMEESYLKNKMFYTLLYLDTKVDNPDQRIVQDTNDFVTMYASILKAIITAPCELVWYTYKANQVLGWLAPVSFYSYFLLALIGNKLVMGPIIRLSWRQEKLDGDYRYVHLRHRTNAESIALYNGADASRVNMQGKFALVFKNRLTTLYRLIGLNTFTNLFAYIGSLGPYLLLSIPMFAGASLGRSPGEVAGDVYKAVAVSISLMYAFTQVINVSQDFSTWAGSASRCGQLLEHMTNLHRQAITNKNKPLFTTLDEDRNTSDSDDGSNEDISIPSSVPNPGIHCITDDVSFKHVTVFTPTGVALAHDLTFHVATGQSTLIMGPSGCGKSSLLRVLGGLWHTFTGTLSTPTCSDPSEVLFLPQQPCISVGTLREQVVYPIDPSLSHRASDTRVLQELINVVGLGYLSDLSDWDATINWPSVLSPGEQQRLALARVFFHRPRFAIFDEATSAVEEDLERDLYHKCIQDNITTISVGQRRTLMSYHKQLVTCDHLRRWHVSSLDTQ